MKIIQYLIFIMLALFYVSCSDNGLDESTSAFDNWLNKEQNEFDQWLDRYYLKPYNIQVIYNYVDTYSNYDYDLIPADFEKSKILCYAARYLWIEPYEELVNAGFFRVYAPRVLHFVGNPGWKSNDTWTMGEAEGGLRISFFNVNGIVPGKPHTYLSYLKTMHHEYAHIFQQKKVTDPAFDQITSGTYKGDRWNDNKDYLKTWRTGYVSSYASSSPAEDFVEVYSIYVTSPPESWESMLEIASTDENGNAVEGANFIRKKFEIVYKYYKESWGIDISKLRDIVNRRKKEIESIDFNTLYK